MAVVIAFFICWAPFHTQRITAFVTRLLDKANKNTISEAATKFQEILFFTSGNSLTKSFKRKTRIFFHSLNTTNANVPFFSTDDLVLHFKTKQSMNYS